VIIVGFGLPAALPAYSSQTEINASIQDAGPDLIHIRSGISVDPAENLISGSVRAEFEFSEPLDRSILFMASGYIFKNIFVGTRGSSSNIFRPDTLEGPLHIQIPDSITADRFYVGWDYESSSSLHTYPLGRNSGTWTSVFARPDAGHGITGGLLIDAGDVFSGELRVTVPSDWTIYTGSTGEERGVFVASDDHTTQIIAIEPGTRLPELSMVAFSSDNSSFRLADTKQDSTFFDEIPLRSSVFRSFRLDGTRSPTRFVSPSLKYPEVLSAFVDFVPDPNFLDPPVPDKELLFLAQLAAARVTRRARIYQSESERWISDATEAYLVAEYVEDSQGLDFRAVYMNTLRNEYLSDPASDTASLISDGDSRLGESARRAKGAWIFQMISDRVGNDVLLKTLVEFQEGSPEDFTHSPAFFQEILERRSGHDLDQFIRDWTGQPGHPVVDYHYSVRSTQDAIDVRILQTGNYTFSIYSELAVYTIAGFESTPVEISREDESFTIPVDLRPQAVLLDPAGRVLFETSLELGAENFITPLRRASSSAEVFGVLNQIGDRSIDPSHLLGIRPLLSIARNDNVHAGLLRLYGLAAPSGSALRDLLAAAESESVVVRSAAILALSSFTGAPEARASALAAANGSQDPSVLSAAVETLISVDSTLVVPVLQSAMVTESQNDYVRRQAVYSISRVHIEDEALWELIEPLITAHTHPATRLAALEASRALFENDHIRASIVERWPFLSDDGRAILIQSYRNIVPIDFLPTDERDELTRWLNAEPNPIFIDGLFALMAMPDTVQPADQ